MNSEMKDKLFEKAVAARLEMMKAEDDMELEELFIANGGVLPDEPELEQDRSKT